MNQKPAAWSIAEATGRSATSRAMKTTMKRKDIIIASAVILLIAALGYLWLSPAGLQRAPNITLSTITGKKVELSKLRGRPVLVNFWATTCPGCVAEIPQLAALYRDLSPKGLEIIGVAMSYDPPSQVMRMSKQRAIPYPIALDLKGQAAQAFGGVQLTPTSFLISPDGRIVKQKIGEVDINALRRQIEAMLPKA